METAKGKARQVRRVDFFDFSLVGYLVPLDTRALKFYISILSAELLSPLNYYKLLLLFNKREDVSQS